MDVSIHVAPHAANAAAADLLASWLTAPDVRSIMLAAGNTPLELYRLIGERRLALSHLKVFALDEYVGVPLDEPRSCANLIRHTAVEPWGVPPPQYFSVSSLEPDALASVHAHERRIVESGGLDVIVLGLGQNGHLGFNEPGSDEHSIGRLVQLESSSIEANRKWFEGKYAPMRGVTVGMKTILSARRVLIMAYGAHKTTAVKAMLEGPRTSRCPASLLQNHADVTVFLDEAAAALLEKKADAAEKLTKGNDGNEEQNGKSALFPSFASVQNFGRCVLGIDVGGTKIAAGLLAMPEGCALARRIIPTRAARGGRPVLDDVLQLARELAEEASACGHSIEAIGLGICELVDHEGDLASANAIQWLDQPVREQLSNIAPTIIEADVRAAALAEALFGAGKPFRSFLFVTVGTGISCCLMLDGKPWLGANGVTGTMASSPLSIPCEQCGHVNRRTLEEIAAGPALVARLNAAGGKATSGEEVLKAAAADNSSAKQVVESASEALASQIGLLVNTLDPEAVVIGGGLGLSDGPYWEHFIISTRRHIWSHLHRNLPILRAATGVDAGWIGAAAQAALQSSLPTKSTNQS